MKIKLKRIKTTLTETFGSLYINDELVCFTLEDIKNDPKVFGKTRIPEGTYKINYNTTGGMNYKYKKLFPDVHKGMLEICNVPNFTDIYIHIGNTHIDTNGCVLVGLEIGNGCIRESKQAYKKIYSIISKALDNKEDTSIEIVSEEA